MKRWLNLRANQILFFLERKDSVVSSLLLPYVSIVIALLPVGWVWRFVVSLILIGIPSIALVIRSRGPFHYILGLAVLPEKKKREPELRTDMEKFCVEKGYAFLPHEVFVVGGNKLVNDRVAWLRKVDEFSYNLQRISPGTDSKRWVHVFLAAPTILSFMCGTICYKRGGLRVYHYSSESQAEHYRLAALWYPDGKSRPADKKYEDRQLLADSDYAHVTGKQVLVSVECHEFGPQANIATLGRKLKADVVRICLREETPKLDSNDASMDWYLATEITQRLGVLHNEMNNNTIHLCITAHNAVSFLLGAMLGTNGSPIHLYHFFPDDDDRKQWERVLSTADLDK